jgi:hypothetical protein
MTSFVCVCRSSSTQSQSDEPHRINNSFRHSPTSSTKARSQGHRQTSHTRSQTEPFQSTLRSQQSSRFEDDDILVFTTSPVYAGSFSCAMYNLHILTSSLLMFHRGKQREDIPYIARQDVTMKRNVRSLWLRASWSCRLSFVLIYYA